jgi:REP element-mobilizing transposase RayT
MITKFGLSVSETAAAAQQRHDGYRFAAHRCRRKTFRSRVAKGERDIWQRRYWERMLRNERDYARHCDYIHPIRLEHG